MACSDGMACLDSNDDNENVRLGTLELVPGYYRHTTETYTVLVCETPEACLGGNQTNMASCADGYEGPLCHECTESFYWDSISNTCEVCTGAFVPVIAISTVLLIGIIIALTLAAIPIPFVGALKRCLEDFGARLSVHQDRAMIVVATLQ